MTVERMKRPWNVVGAGFNDDGVYFTFDDTTIHRADVRLMEAAPDLLEALQQMVGRIEYYASLKETEQPNIEDWAYTYNSGDMDEARAAISKALGEE